MDWNSKEVGDLWKQYSRSRSIYLRNKLVVIYMPIVKRTAEVIQKKIPGSVTIDELISAGNAGLIRCVERFNIKMGKFISYALYRIKGGMLDYLREIDSASRCTRKVINKLLLAEHNAELKCNRKPTDIEVAKELNVSLSEYDKMNIRTKPLIDLIHKRVNVNSLITIPDQKNGVAFNKILFKELLLKIKDMLKCFPREYSIMDMYYTKNMTLKEIGKKMGISESRTCQLHRTILAKIRKRLKKGGENG